MERSEGDGRAGFATEQEIDLRTYLTACRRRWWLLVLGLIAGAVVGFLFALGGSSRVWKAQATVYMGQPLSPSGGAAIQSLATNPSSVHQIVTSESVVRSVAAKVGLKPRALRSGIATDQVAGALSTKGQNPLVTITVTGHPAAKVAAAANALAGDVVTKVGSGYVGAKIRTIKTEIASDRAQLTMLAERIAATNKAAAQPGLTPLDKLVIVSQADTAETRQAAVAQDLVQEQQLLTLAQNVEAARIVTPAVAVESSARSRRAATSIGAVIGLVLSLLAALYWNARDQRRRPAAS